MMSLERVMRYKMKLINKYVFIFLFIGCSISAMDEHYFGNRIEIFWKDCCNIIKNVVEFIEQKKQDPSIPCDDICHLNRLPVDALNCIAGFLIESEQEFIERMPNIYEVKKIHNYYTSEDLFVSCPDNINDVVATSAQYCWTSWLNLHHNAIDYKKHIEESVIKCIAFSRHMNMIAMVRSEQRSYGTYEVCDWDNFLEIQKIDLEKNENAKEGKIVFGHKQELNDYVHSPTLMGFNKQGTLFMTCRKDNETEEFNHHIYSLKKIVFDDDVKPSNKLQKYFRDNMVCNNYIKGAEK